MTKLKLRTLYFDYLRIIATIAVIAIHTTSQKLVLMSFNGDWHILNIINGCSRWAVPIFFMISGALFLDPNRQISIKKLYTKNILRLLTAFFFWSVIYSLIHHRNDIGDFVLSIFKGHYHMWFILSIAGLYILTPLLRKITASKKATEYFLILAFFLSILPKFLVLIFDCINTFYLPVASDILSSFLSSLNLKMIQGYSFFYVLGHYLHTTEIKKSLRTIVYILGGLGFISTIGLTILFSYINQKFFESFYAYGNINIIMEAVCIFVFAKYELSKIQLKERSCRFVQNISKYTFGCYLLHDIPIYCLAIYLHIDSTYYSPILAVPFIVFVTFVSCTLVSAAINHIPILKKYIV